MVIIHLQHFPRLRVEICLCLLLCQVAEWITKTVDMQRGQADGIVSRLLVDIFLSLTTLVTATYQHGYLGQKTYDDHFPPPSVALPPYTTLQTAAGSCLLLHLPGSLAVVGRGVAHRPFATPG